GSQDVVVSRLSANGSTLQMSTYIGGSAFETGTGIALDANNNIYVSGRTSSTNFPTTAGAYKVVKGASIDAFVTKLDTAGGIVYSTFIGGDGNDEAHDIAVDGLNRAYITGQTEGGTYPILGAFDPTYNGGAWDAFVTRLTANGAALSYSSYLGGSGYDYGYGIAVSANEAYVTGYTTSSNFTCVAGAYDTTYNGAGDAFVTRVAANGASLVASTFVGGTDTDSGEDIALGGQGHVFITGWAASPNYPTTLGASDTSHNGGTDVIVTKLNGALASLTYSTFAGGSSNDYGYGIAINSAGGAAATGLTSSTDFPVVIPTQAAFGGGVNDAFVLRVVPTGASLNFSTYLGGGGYEYARAVALDSAGLPIVTGVASDALFPTVPGSYDVTHNGVWDVFVTKLQP
ncbi:MAG TPA: SBBP repeat-containing protein, partial [Kofleriaceae bacterium]|nr:SBBP repeat-containing protein [Kofleriaceae bacterium]